MTMDVQGNQTFVVAVMNFGAFQLRKVGNQLVGVTGRDFKVLQILSNKMRFQYKLVRSYDGQWGNCDDIGRCNGLIGMVARYEADMAISEISYTPSRAKYVNFSYPYFHDEVTFVTKNIDAYEEINSLFFTEPFDKRVWIFLAFLLVVFVSLVKILEYFELLRTNITSLQTILQIILRQTVNMERKEHKPSLVTTLLAFVITAGCTCKLYECVLASSTTLDPTNSPIDTISDMVNAIQNRDYAIGAGRENSYYRIIKTSKLEYMKIFAQSTWNRNFKAPKTAYELMKTVINEKFALVAARITMNRILIEMNLPWETLHRAKETLFVDHMAVVFNKQFQRKDDIDKWLNILVASGLIDKWDSEDLSLLKRSTRGTKNTCASSYINMSDLKLIFVSLASGHLAGFVILLMEIITNYLHTRLSIG